jgi:O-antigen/teichoic acid export membrane protein
LDRAVRGFATHQALILVPASLGLAASAPILLPLLLGDTWRPSIPVLQALGCLAAVATFASPTSTAILAVGASRGRASLELIRVSVSVGALLVGMRWGIGGVGWALVLAAGLLLPVQLGAARVIVPLRIAPYLGQLAVPALGAVIMAAVVVALRVVMADRLSAPVLLGVMIGGGAAVYAAIVWLFNRELAREALDSLRRALRSPAGGAWLPERR